MTAATVSIFFIALVVVQAALQLWLTRRQIAHVLRHRAEVPLAFRNAISTEAHGKAADYTCAKQRFGLWQFGFGVLLLLAWTLGGGLDALNEAILHFFVGDGVPSGDGTPNVGLASGDLAYQIALLLAFGMIGGLLDLPFDWYYNFHIEERFGFNRMTPRIWFSDLLKSLIVSLLIGAPLIAVVLWLMDTAGPAWWLWAWVFWMTFNLLLMVVYPLLIAPLFNEFKPLADETLGLFVMDGSKRSAQSNAYFTGIGRSKRVVFYDTLIARLSAGEVEAVLAHELGHFHHKHIVKMIVQIFLMSLLGLATLGFLAQQPEFYLGLGVTPNANVANDGLALALFMLVLPCVSFVLAPLSSRASRRHEFQADAYAKANASGDDLASALVKLTEDNASTLTPDPLYVAFHYSHPPMVERIAAIKAG
ncbi:MAG: M48 family peptidase [Gammaproteobacteria bacterium]|nr:M48 family peptidase [Gammaproteobacteria bacterium]